MRSGEMRMPKTELLNCLLLAMRNWYMEVVSFYNTLTKQKWHALNPPVNRHETAPTVARLITCCASAHRLFRFEKLEAWEARKKRGWKIKFPKKK